jgi:hypothetical protein
METPGFIEKNKTLLIIIVIFTVIAVCGIILFFVFKKEKTSDDPTLDDPTSCSRVGKLYDNESKSCSECQDQGYYSSDGINCNEFCIAGSFLDRTNNKCEKCSFGYFNSESKKQGTHRSDGCEICPPGTKANSDATSCTDCPAGTFSPKGSVECKNCDDGTYSSAKAGYCARCDKGQMPNQGQTDCVEDPDYGPVDNIKECSLEESDTPAGCDPWARVKKVISDVKSGADLRVFIDDLNGALVKEKHDKTTQIKYNCDGCMSSNKVSFLPNKITITTSDRTSGIIAKVNLYIKPPETTS